ncbi:hypothetical protein ACQP1O_21345 [Nocardia sp. CA-151230]|uniref:hypothetical protein n=1 Tax=Nocardia sp. CA-151230 TaxID=3239982 RepID=UPI003D92D1E2
MTTRFPRVPERWAVIAVLLAVAVVLAAAALVAILCDRDDQSAPPPPATVASPAPPATVASSAGADFRYVRPFLGLAEHSAAQPHSTTGQGE